MNSKNSKIIYTSLYQEYIQYDSMAFSFLTTVEINRKIILWKIKRIIKRINRIKYKTVEKKDKKVESLVLEHFLSDVDSVFDVRVTLNFELGRDFQKLGNITLNNKFRRELFKLLQLLYFIDSTTFIAEIPNIMELKIWKYQYHTFDGDYHPAIDAFISTLKQILEKLKMTKEDRLLLSSYLL